MVGKKDFDNLQLSIAGAVTLASDATQSVEIDMDIPRGFIAKVWKIELFIFRTALDFAIFVTEGNNEVQFSAGVIADPDDTVTISRTSNRVLHDILHELEIDFWLDVGAVDPDGRGPVLLDFYRSIEFPEHIDVILARNPRLNAVAGGSAKTSITESIAKTVIHYTLEKVTDADILNLLDIL